MGDLDVETSKNVCDSFRKSFGVGEDDKTTMVGTIHFLLSTQLTAIVNEFCRVVILFLKESQTFFEVSASRSLINLFVPPRTYSKNQKTRSRKMLPEASFTRSNAKIVTVFMLVRHHAR